MYYSIFSGNIPEFLEELAQTPPMLRLDGIGMHCSLEYTAFPAYMNLAPYSRRMHSIGTARIVWHFTHDRAQAAAGLLHDIASPVFSHVIDFLQGDHLTQESTEADTGRIIEAASSIQKILAEQGLVTAQVSDYHLYPVADNPSPRLSADRLEYSFGNFHMVQHRPLDELSALYEDIRPGEDERGTPELVFGHLEEAALFAHMALVNARWYVTDEDRFAMQYLADLLRRAMELNILNRNDLYTTEQLVIKKLNEHPETADIWANYCRLNTLERHTSRPEGRYAVNIPAKRRYIDPLVMTAQGAKRASDLSPAVRDDISDFLADNFNRWLTIPE